MGNNYITKVYKDQNGDRMVVESGGVIYLKAGSTLTLEDGTIITGLPVAAYMEEIASSVNTVAGLRTELNQLIGFLKAAGLMVSAAPTIIVTDQPVDLELVAGAIDSEDVIAAAFEVSDGGTPTYQWYSNSSDSNEGGSAISEAESASYTIPAETTAGTYYYYCVASYEGVTQASDPVTVTVAAE